MGKLDVVSIGGINCDTVALVSKFPEAEVKINSGEYIKYGVAGVAVDCLTQVSRLVLKRGHIGKMGDDYYAGSIPWASTARWIFVLSPLLYELSPESRQLPQTRVYVLWREMHRS